MDIEANMIYAPIMILTCNRYQHLERCIESLKRNGYAKETELFISVDYPPNDEYVEGWQKVCELLKKPIEGFKNVNIFFQDVNLGEDKNEEFLYERVYAIYDRVILSEDDNEFSPNFIEYIDKGLMIYENDPNVFGVCGYGYEYEFNVHGNNILALSNFNMWGCGLWRDKERLISEQLSYRLWEKKARNIFIMHRLYRNRKRMFSRMLGTLLGEQFSEKLDRTDVNRAIILSLNGWYTVNPVVSKVRNWGWDGSGINIIGNNMKQVEYEKQAIDTNPHFEYKSDKIQLEVSNNRLLDSHGEWQSDRAKWYNDPLTYLLYWVLGKKNFFKYIRKE